MTAARLLLVATYVAIGMTLVTYLLLLVGSILRPELAARAGMGSLIWLLPLAALLAALKEAFLTLCLRTDRYKSMAMSLAAETGVTAISRIVWGLMLSSSIAGLVLGHFLGVAIGGLICVIACRSWIAEHFAGMRSWKLLSVMRDFSDYPKFRAPARLAFNAAKRMPVIALGLIFPAEVVGFYAMANRSAGMPLQAASQSVSNVFLRDLIKTRDRDLPLLPGVRRVLGILLLTGIPMFLVVYFLGGELLTWFLGARWQQAGVFIEILALYLFSTWVSSFASTIFETLRLNKVMLRMHFGNLLVRLLVFIACAVVALSPTETLWLFAVVCSAYQFLIVIVAMLKARRHDAGLETGGTPA